MDEATEAMGLNASLLSLRDANLPLIQSGTRIDQTTASDINRYSHVHLSFSIPGRDWTFLRVKSQNCRESTAMSQQYVIQSQLL